jgi:hypothetical protein
MLLTKDRIVSIGTKVIITIPSALVIFLLMLTLINMYPFIRHDILSILGMLH